MLVSLRTCVLAWMQENDRVLTRVLSFVRAYECVCESTLGRVYVSALVRVCLCVCVHERVRACVHVCLRAYVRV